MEYQAKAPDFKGEGIDAWVGKTKHGSPYLKVKRPEWKCSLVLFKYNPKPKQTTPQPSQPLEEPAKESAEELLAGII